MAAAENSGRAAILQRIRNALKTPAKVRHAHDNVAAAVVDIFPPVSDPLQRFRHECAGNKTELIVTPNFDASVTAASAILAELQVGEVFVQDAPQLRDAAAQFGAGRSVRWSCDGGPLEATDVTVTLAELLVAQTGS